MSPGEVEGRPGLLNHVLIILRRVGADEAGSRAIPALRRPRALAAKLWKLDLANPREAVRVWDNRAMRTGRVQTTNPASAGQLHSVAGYGLSAEDLSLTAELLLLAIDPGRGGLFPRRRRRFRKALAAAHQAERGDARRAAKGARGARREAVRELERVGLVQPRRVFGRLRLADSTRAGKRFQQLVRCVQENELTDPRDRELLLLLAWSGVLAHRLSYEERRLAVRRLRKFVPPPKAGVGQARLRGQAPVSEMTAGLGVVGLAAGGAGFDFGGCEASFGGGGGYGGGAAGVGGAAAGAGGGAGGGGGDGGGGSC